MRGHIQQRGATSWRLKVFVGRDASGVRRYKRNYGDMARLLSPLIAEETIGATAGMVRETCAEFSLDGFEIRRLDFEAPAVCEVDVELLSTARLVRHACGGSAPARMAWLLPRTSLPSGA